MNRRGFLQSILAAGIAPYVATTAGVLMPVRQIATPLWGKSIVSMPDVLAAQRDMAKFYCVAMDKYGDVLTLHVYANNWVSIPVGYTPINFVAVERFTPSTVEPFTINLKCV